VSALPEAVAVRNGGQRHRDDESRRSETGSDLRLSAVGRGGVEPPTFHFSGGRSYQLSYLPKRTKLYNTRHRKRESTAAPVSRFPRSLAVRLHVRVVRRAGPSRPLASIASMTDSDLPRIPDDAVTFPDGARMPLLGFGTWQLKGETATSATQTALEAGYRHVDTATIYDNEAEVGRALRTSGLSRGDVFVTTKCPPHHAGRELETLEQSLEKLGLDFVDLWLIHWTPENGVGVDLWQRFIEARDRGLAKDIGVSNYRAEQIDELVAETGVKPVVNQIKWSPLLFQAAVLDQHRERDIALEGYSGLRGGTLEDDTVRGIAERFGRTPAQVIVRWQLQHGVITIPKSAQVERIRSNADVGGFELASDDMVALDALGGR
jgi:2,5-diketo-D-gluconate reductase A